MNYMEWNCPECGAPLKVYAEYPIHVSAKDKCSYPVMEIELIRHCSNCLSDWKNIYTTQQGQTGETELERKFWG